MRGFSGPPVILPSIPVLLLLALWWVLPAPLAELMLVVLRRATKG